MSWAAYICEQRAAITEIDNQMSILDAKLDSRMGELDAKMDRVLAQLRGLCYRISFGSWATGFANDMETVVVLLGCCHIT